LHQANTNESLKRELEMNESKLVSTRSTIVMAAFSRTNEFEKEEAHVVVVAVVVVVVYCLCQ
jgi:hypothetical protein